MKIILKKITSYYDVSSKTFFGGDHHPQPYSDTSCANSFMVGWYLLLMNVDMMITIKNCIFFVYHSMVGRLVAVRNIFLATVQTQTDKKMEK